MGSREAIRLLLDAGFEFVRRGKGDHVIMQRGRERVVVPNGKTEIASGMARKIWHVVKRAKEQVV